MEEQNNKAGGGNANLAKPYKWFKDSCAEFIKTFPVQFHLPTHNAKFCNDEYYKFQRDVSNPRQIDGSWFGLYDVEGISIEDGRLCDLGQAYHDVFKSVLTLFVQNGSSLGNQMVCMSLARKKVLIQCNSHISVFNGLQMSQAQICLLRPKHNLKFDVYMPIDKDDVLEGLRQHPDAEVVYLTSPTFEGLLCNYKEIREVIGEHRILVIDEAHGSHLYFNKDSDFLKGAMQSGAVDVCVSSAHKNLGALSAAAFINVAKNKRIDPDQIKEIFIMLNTTSPSPYTYFDMEGAFRTMLGYG